MEFIKHVKHLKIEKAERAATGLSGVCKAQKSAKDQVDRSLRRMDSAMIALHSTLNDNQKVTAEQFVQVLQPYTNGVLDRQELFDIFYKLDAKSVGQIAMRLTEEENRKAMNKAEEQMVVIQKRKSARERLQKAVGAVQNMRKSIKAMLVSQKSKKVAPSAEFDEVAPKPKVEMDASWTKESQPKVTNNLHSDSHSDSEDEEEFLLLQKRIADLKAAKDKKEKDEQAKKQQRQAKMEALRKEMELLQSEAEED
jgi:hypothetical protein